MRRAISVLLSLGLLAVFASPVAGAKPVKTDLEPIVQEPSDFAGTCSFPVRLVDRFASSQLFEFAPDRNGDLRFMFTGGFKSTLTNMDTGKSIDITFFGQVRIVEHTDGTADLTSSGGVLHWYTAADAAFFGRPAGIYLVHGRFEGTMDSATGLLIEPAKVRGHVTDICAALS